MEMKIDIKRRHSSPVSGLSHKSLQFSIVSITLCAVTDALELFIES